MGTVTFTAAPYDGHRSEARDDRSGRGRPRQARGHGAREGSRARHARRGPNPRCAGAPPSRRPSHGDRTRRCVHARGPAGRHRADRRVGRPRKGVRAPEARRARAGNDQPTTSSSTATGEIRVVVVDEEGHAVSGTYVEFHLANGGDDACEGMTDTAGRFDCPMLLGGDYAPRVQPAQGTQRGFAPANGRFRSCT